MAFITIFYVVMNAFFGMARKLTTEEFIEQARKVHGDKYDYSKVEYKSSGEKITIICPKHGEFQKTPENHLHKTRPQGCPICEKENVRYNQLSSSEFIEKAREVHGNKFDYSKVEYVNNHTKITIICPKHGEFLQSPQAHLTSKFGCRLCANESISSVNKVDNNKFIENAKKVHGNKYDYSKISYVNNKTPISIVCPKHGEFWQTPDNHLQGKGCKKCKNDKLSKIRLTNWDILLKKMNTVHNDKYKYVETSYIDTNHKISIICPIHGKFEQTPHSHLSGQGCPSCNGGIRLSRSEFIEKAVQVHGNKYAYDNVEYVNSETKVCIICKEHGEFWQKPIVHLRGCGCKKCQDSHLEKEVELALQEFDCVPQYKIEWLGRQSLDFYIPKYNIAIECQGKQHFGLGWAIKMDFENEIKKRDIRKKQLCEEHGIKLFYFSHEPYDEFLGEKVYHDIDELIEKIKNG